jgi:hypothetical protein
MGFADGTLVLKAFRFGIYCRKSNLVTGYSLLLPATSVDRSRAAGLPEGFKNSFVV